MISRFADSHVRFKHFFVLVSFHLIDFVRQISEFLNQLRVHIDGRRQGVLFLLNRVTSCFPFLLILMLYELFIVALIEFMLLIDVFL